MLQKIANFLTSGTSLSFIAIIIASFLVSRLVAFIEKYLPFKGVVTFLIYFIFWAVFPFIFSVKLLIKWIGENPALAIIGLLFVALHSTLFNAVAYVYLKRFKLFKKGDLIKVGEVEGIVESYAMFNTILKTHDKSRVFIPNSKIVNEILTIKNSC